MRVATKFGFKSQDSSSARQTEGQRARRERRAVDTCGVRQGGPGGTVACAERVLEAPAHASGPPSRGEAA
eukprot:2291755-Prymnesium_polylepis.2